MRSSDARIKDRNEVSHTVSWPTKLHVIYDDTELKLKTPFPFLMGR